MIKGKKINSDLYYRPSHFTDPKFPYSKEQLERVAPYKPHEYTMPLMRRLKFFFKMLIVKFKYKINA